MPNSLTDMIAGLVLAFDISEAFLLAATGMVSNPALMIFFPVGLPAKISCWVGRRGDTNGAVGVYSLLCIDLATDKNKIGQFVNMDHEQKSGTAGTIFALFVAVHLFNHVYSILGANRHLALMTSLRHVYRHFAVETILIGTIVVQIVSGLGYLWTVESRPFPCSTN